MHQFNVIRLAVRAVPSLGLSQEISYLLGWRVHATPVLVDEGTTVNAFG